MACAWFCACRCHCQRRNAWCRFAALSHSRTGDLNLTRTNVTMQVGTTTGRALGASKGHARQHRQTLVQRRPGLEYADVNLVAQQSARRPRRRSAIWCSVSCCVELKKTGGFGRLAGHKPQRCLSASRRFATTPGGQRRAFMFHTERKTALALGRRRLVPATRAPRPARRVGLASTTKKNGCRWWASAQRTRPPPIRRSSMGLRTTPALSQQPPCVKSKLTQRQARRCRPTRSVAPCLRPPSL